MTQNTMAQIRNLDEVKGSGSRRGFFWLALIVVLAVVAAIFLVAYYSAEKSDEEFESGVRQEMRGIVISRANDVNNWIKGLLEQTARFTNSGVIKDFAMGVDELGDSVTVLLHPSSSAQAQPNSDREQPAELSDINLLQSYLSNFVAYSEFNFGGMLNSRGELYISTDPAYESLDSRQRGLAHEVVQSGEAKFGLARTDSARGLLLELYTPIVSLARNEKGEFNVVAVLYLTLSISPKLNEMFNLDGYSNQGYAVHLLQKRGENWQQVAFRQDRVRDMAPITVGADGNIDFALRESVAEGGKKVYSQGSKAHDLDWWVLWELDYAQARIALDSKIRDIYILCSLASLALVLLVSVIWRWFISMERSNTLAKFQELFAVIDEQKKLLDSINGNIADPISLTDTKGIFRYVNQAFADAFGRDINTIPGMDTSAVCGFDTAKRLNSSDQHVLMTGESVTTNEMIWLQSKRHYFQIAKSPLRDADNSTITGIVAVYRDVTQLVETEERSHRMVQQTVDALVRAIEQVDPFLGGHSRIMGEAARMIGTALNLSPKDISTIETAATLSQIGKMFVPRDVLSKPGALTPEEKKIMEQHVEHTVKVLERIEFDLPVLEAISQMNEKLDGSGYPKGLHDKEISIHARVLSVANAFAAMARPRSYRPAMDAETVLSIMDKQSGTYDAQVVEVLRQVLRTPAGEKLVATVASSKPV